MTAIWTPSRELWTPRKPSLLRKVTDWVRMATAGQTLLNSSGQTAMNSSGQELVYDTGGCTCCGGIQSCVTLISIGVSFGTKYTNSSSTYYMEVEAPTGYTGTLNFSSTTGSNIVGVPFEAATGNANVFVYNSSGVLHEWGPAVINPGSTISSPSSMQLSTFGSSTGCLTWSIPLSSTGAAVPGTYDDSERYGVAATISFPSSSPINGEIGSSVSVSGGPITQVRDAAGTGSYAIPANTSTPWNGSLSVSAGATCSTITGTFGYEGTTSGVASWDGYALSTIYLYSWGIPTPSTAADNAPMWSLVFGFPGSSATPAYYFLNSNSSTGTYQAVDPLTVPQTLTVS